MTTLGNNLAFTISFLVITLALVLFSKIPFASATTSRCCYDSGLSCTSVTWKQVIYNPSANCKRFFMAGNGYNGIKDRISECQPHPKLSQYPKCNTRIDPNKPNEGCADNSAPLLLSCRSITPEMLMGVTFEPPFFVETTRCSEFSAIAGDGLGKKCIPNPYYNFGAGTPCIEGDFCVANPCYYENSLGGQPACFPKDDCPRGTEDNAKCSNPFENNIDLSVSEIIPVQVINNPPHFVENKGIVVRVRVSLGETEGCEEKEGVEVKLTFGRYTETKSATVKKEYSNNEKKEGKDTINFFIPAEHIIAGEETIYAELDPNDKVEETDECNNLNNNIKITIKNQYISKAKSKSKLVIKFIPIKVFYDAFAITPPEHNWEKEISKEFFTFSQQSLQVVRDVYPLADVEFKIGTIDFPVEKDRQKYRSSNNPKPNPWAMLKELGKMAKKDKTADIYAGITPLYWLSNVEKLGASGIANKKNALLVHLGGGTDTLAHEMGHNFGLRLASALNLNAEEKKDYPKFGLPASDGWNYREGDAGARINIDQNRMNAKEQDTSINRKQKYFCFMGEDYDVEGGEPWIDREDYIKLLNQMTK